MNTTACNRNLTARGARSFPGNFPGCLCSISFYLAFAVFAQAADDSTNAKLPVPRQPAQAKADHELREQLQADFAKHDAGGYLALARKLRDESGKNQDSATRFVMLKESRELFINAGDLKSALAVVDQMGASYPVDVRDMKLGVMSVAVDKALIEPEALTTLYLNLGDRFLTEGDVDLAEHACRAAQVVMLNRRIHDPELEKRLKEQHRTVMIALKETQRVLGAMRKLKAHPEDPDANLIVGKYACFFRGLWGQSLPMLSKGSDSHLKMLADEELKVPSSADAMTSLADGWWALADSATTPVARRKIRLHAAEWYEKAIPQLEGEKKRTAQERAADSSE